MKHSIALIAAVAANGVIGVDNRLPWRLSDDLKRFRELTTGHAVIMGRKTWESLRRPLPDRQNIVVTRQAGWQAEGAEAVGSVEAAVKLCADAPLAWIIGGSEIYKLSLPLADFAVVTEIEADFEGDAFAPALDSSWHETARERHVTAAGLAYSFVTYEKR